MKFQLGLFNVNFGVSIHKIAFEASLSTEPCYVAFVMRPSSSKASRSIEREDVRRSLDASASLQKCDKGCQVAAAHSGHLANIRCQIMVLTFSRWQRICEAQKFTVCCNRFDVHNSVGKEGLPHEPIAGLLPQHPRAKAVLT